MQTIKCIKCNKTILANYKEPRKFFKKKQLERLKFILSSYPCLKCSGEVFDKKKEKKSGRKNKKDNIKHTTSDV